MPTPMKTVKMLVSIINEQDQLPLTETLRNFGYSLNFSGFAFGTAKSNYLSYLAIDDLEKRLVYSLIPEEREKQILSAINKNLRLYHVGRGIAFTIPLSSISSIISCGVLTKKDGAPPLKKKKKTNTEGKKKKMNELILAVVNQDYTDAVIESARSAGATGATVLHTRSVANNEIEQQMGTKFFEETDTVCILTTSDYKTKIMEAIRDTAGLKTEGRAVLLSLPVDSLIGIGKFEEDEE